MSASTCTNTSETATLSTHLPELAWQFDELSDRLLAEARQLRQAHRPRDARGRERLALRLRACARACQSTIERREPLTNALSSVGLIR
jgi:hypothetical protein